MKIGCPSCKKAIFDSSLRKCPNCGKEFTDKEIKSRVRLTKLAYFSIGFAAFMIVLAFFLPKMEVTIKDDIVVHSDRQTTFRYSDKYTKIEPKYAIFEANDTSIPGVKRMTVKIVFPSGQVLNEEYLQEQLIYATFTAMFENKMDAVTVWAYNEGDDYSGAYTLATCVAAPYGELRRAGEKVGKKDIKAVFTLSPEHVVIP